MLSRVADTIYWMNRYLERAENYARFMDVNYNLSLESHVEGSEPWKPLIMTTSDWELFESSYAKPDRKSAIRFLGFDSDNPNSILACVTNARENGRAIRPEITKEVWENLNGFYYKVKEGVEKKIWEKKDPREFFTQVKECCQLLTGIYDSTISRTQIWHFGKLGQFIERADKTSRLLDVKYHMITPASIGETSLDVVQWSALLKSVSAYVMYLRKNGKLTPDNICEFLVFDKLFPRSIMYCVQEARTSLDIISRINQVQKNVALDEIEALEVHLSQISVEEVLDHGLHEFLDDIQLKLNNVSMAIFDTFFSVENVLKRPVLQN